MSDPRITEERLRSWLDTNQPQRERLCVHLLPLLGRYGSVEPRRPKGGPDGARDLQAIHNNTLVVWGAIGFKNSANDTPEQKRWVKQKFEDDLNAALAEKPDLKGFVFFTNVDLTPAEQKELTSHATTHGIGHIEVFYRERLRQILDSSEGLAYRLQYLNLEMSREEQMTFIGRLQAAREEELADLKAQQEAIAAQTQRLEFLNECLRPVHEVGVFVRFRQAVALDTLGHFRIAAEIVRSYASPSRSLFVAGGDYYKYAREDGTHVLCKNTLAWATEPNETLFSKDDVFPEVTQLKEIDFRAPLYRRGPFDLVGDFDRTGFNLFVTEPLLGQLATIGFVVNGYVLVEIAHDAIAVAEEVGLTENSPPVLPEPMSSEEEAVRWRRVYIRIPDTSNAALPPPYRQAAREINFNAWTPYRLGLPNVPSGPLGNASLVVHGQFTMG